MLTKSDLSAMKEIVRAETDPIKRSVNDLQKGQRKIIRELNKWTKFFDRDYVNLKKYTAKIAEKVGIPASEF